MTLRDKILSAVRVIPGINHDELSDLILDEISEGCEPVYQHRTLMYTQGWADIDAEHYALSSPNMRRILYTAPQVVASEPVAVIVDPDSRGFAVNNSISELLPIGTELFATPQPLPADDRDALIAELQGKLASSIACEAVEHERVLELQARLDAAEKDAARYQMAVSDLFAIARWSNSKSEWMIMNDETAVEMLDAAIAAGKEGV